ncbi:MAG: DUF2911 domain-containing protein [Gemmatimonadales bacterium]
MSVKSFACGVAVMAATAAGAQTVPVSGAFVSTIGRDTVAIERYTRSGDKLEGDILLRYPRVRVVHYVADLGAGKFKGISVTTRNPSADPASPAPFSMIQLLADSTATVDVLRNGRPDTTASGKRSFKGKGVPQFPTIPPSMAVYEQILAFNPPVGRDSMILSTIASGNPPGTMSLIRHTRDTVVFVNSFSPNWVEILTVDPAGHILAVDASATTVKALTKRQNVLDFDNLVKAWAAREVATGAAGAMSPADSVRAVVGTASVDVVYSRPFRRGRVIFGNVVPWNQVWRTGANAATQFTTSADLMFGNTLVPAGKYTLWTLPTATGTKLIINSQTGQWGTEYDVARDLVRLDMTSATLAQPVDEFTLVVVPQGNAGVLKFSWDDREYSIPFRVK